MNDDDEDLRRWAVEQSRGDLDKAAAIYAWVRPQPKKAVVADYGDPQPEPPRHAPGDIYEDPSEN